MITKMKLPVFFLWGFIFIALIFQGEGFTATKPAEGLTASQAMIRVNLAKSSSTATVRIDSGNYIIKDETFGTTISQLGQSDTIQFGRVGSSIQIVINGEDSNTTYRGPLYLEAIDKEQTNVFSFNNVKYRDDLRVINEDTLAIINVLDIEKYLYGVIAPEIGGSAPAEAMKAQAVVSRSYALNMVRPRNNWDVGIDTATQVYKGYTAETVFGGAAAVQAVNDTQGEVIYWLGHPNGNSNTPIAAYFHANSGGHTEDSENVWANPMPYIKAVSSPYDSYALEHSQTNGWPANSYSWSIDYTKSELLDRINVWNTNNSHNEGAMILVGKIEDIKVSRLQRGVNADTESGRVTQVEIVGSDGKASVYRDRIRTLLGLRSTLFDLKLDSELTVLSGHGNLSTLTKGENLLAVGASQQIDSLNGQQDEYYVLGAGNDIAVNNKVFQNVAITGKGHGHGLGMSQWGAMGMANEGYNYHDIIYHYYNQGKRDSNLVISQYR